MSDEQDEHDDPIMAEVRSNREALSKRFGGDIRKLVEYLNEQAEKSGRKIVSLPARQPSVTPPAA